MYIVSVPDNAVLRSKEIMDLKKQYRAKFGTHFPHFNYHDFPGKNGQLATLTYLEELRKAVESDEPYVIEDPYDWEYHVDEE